jgi:hypothetical protein
MDKQMKKKVVRSPAGKLRVRRGVRFLEGAEPASPRLRGDCRSPSLLPGRARGRGLHPDPDHRDE